MDVHISRAGAVLTARLIGQFWDRRDVQSMDNLTASAIDSAAQRVTVNLERLTFIDSAGIGAIVKAHAMLAKRKIALVVVKPLGGVRETLTLAGINAVVRIVDAEEDAPFAENDLS